LAEFGIIARTADAGSKALLALAPRAKNAPCLFLAVG
jgi:hypothetical protein